jgi:hypothetical protein
MLTHIEALYDLSPPDCLRYIAEEPKYFDYLPIVQQMINSVEITR